MTSVNESRTLLPREAREVRGPLGQRYVEQSGLRYDYAADPSRCPACGGVGIPWAGWFFCDGAADCRAIAMVNGGAVFFPAAPATDEAAPPQPPLPAPPSAALPCPHGRPDWHICPHCTGNA